MSEGEQEQTEQEQSEQVEGVPAESPSELPDEEGEEAEAEEAESHDGEQEPTPETEPAEPAEEPQGLSEKQIEAALKRLEKEATRHRNRVAEIMGTDYEVLLPCPMCDAVNPGYVMPTPDVPERFHAVREFMGDSQPRVLKRDPNTSRCQVCDGHGWTDTDSRVPEQKELVCTECGGKGWIGTRTGLATVPAGSAVNVANGEVTVTEQQLAADTPEAESLRAQGYIVIPPTVPTGT